MHTVSSFTHNKSARGKTTKPPKNVSPVTNGAKGTRQGRPSGSHVIPAPVVRSDAPIQFTDKKPAKAEGSLWLRDGLAIAASTKSRGRRKIQAPAT